MSAVKKIDEVISALNECVYYNSFEGVSDEDGAKKKVDTAYGIVLKFINSKRPKDRSGAEVSDHWETPKWLYNQLNDEFNFDFDPCPLYSKFDGLVIPWGKSNFVNPPYNRVDKPKFIKKAYEEWLGGGKTVVLLIPAATGTKQFHELIKPNAEIRFIKGRVAFAGTNSKGEYVTTNKGKHDSMIVIFREKMK